MPAQRTYLWPALIGLLAVVFLFIALPDKWKQWAPEVLRRPALHLGLDLVGGTQLDFRISEEEIRAQLEKLSQEIADAEKAGKVEEAAQMRLEQQSVQEQERTLVEAIRAVLERRINALGVSEAVITPSYVGNEKHLLVECPGVVDTQECIKVVGKTIQLEFKEEFTEATTEFTNTVRKKANEAFARITKSGALLQAVGQDLGTQLGTTYRDHHVLFRDELPPEMADVWSMQPGKVVMREATVTTAPERQGGQFIPEQTFKGIFLMEVTGPLTQTGRLINEAPKAFELLSKTETGAVYTPREKVVFNDAFPSRLAGTLRGMQQGQLKAVGLEDGTAHVLFLRVLNRGREQVPVSHILVSFKGASNAEPGVTRTKDEALAKAKDLKTQLTGGANFAQLARTQSDGPSRNQAGNLGIIARGDMVPAFEETAFTLPAATVSDPIETQFGYHLIRPDGPVTTSLDQADFDDLQLSGLNALQRAETVVENLQTGKVRSQEAALPVRSLFFSFQPTGWKDTVLDGKHFRAASVTLDPVTGVPVVQIAFDTEGGTMFQELTKRNIGKRIAIFVGGELVSAPVVNGEISGGTAVITGSQNFDEAKLLAQDLNTGAIPAPIYLVGQYTVEATLGAAALRTSLLAALLGTIILMVYMLVVYRLLGLVADTALFIYAILLFAILKLPLFLFSSNYIVLTLAGMAGIILSIGMAVDANVLVFERMKEELRKGKMVKTAVESSFRYAWPAIRDGNVSALITCGILFLVGTSIVKGFAVTLGMGVLLSLFTAVTITRWLLRRVAETKLAERRSLFGVPGSVIHTSAHPHEHN